MWPPFADIRAITAVAGCDADINHIVEKSSAGCDPYGRTGGLGYPPFIYLVARGLGINGGWTNILSLTIGVTFIFAIASISRENALTRAAGGVLLMSLPTQLGLERLNIDILLFIGLLLISLLREKNEIPKPTAVIISSILAFICTATKLYLVIGICGWLIGARLAGGKKPKFDIPVCIAAVAGLLNSITWLASGDNFATPQLGLFSHGLIFKTTYGNVSGSATLASAGFFLIGAYLAGTNKGLRTTLKDYGRNINTGCWGQTQLCMACSGLATWIGCFIATSNWDYRLVFAFPWVLIIADIVYENSLKSERRNQSWLLLAILSAITIQLFCPFLYIWLSGVVGKTMSLSDWVANPSGMLLRHISSLTVNLSDLILVPFFGGSSLIACWSIARENYKGLGEHRGHQAIPSVGLQDPRPPRNL